MKFVRSFRDYRANWRCFFDAFSSAIEIERAKSRRLQAMGKKSARLYFFLSTFVYLISFLLLVVLPLIGVHPEDNTNK